MAMTQSSFPTLRRRHIGSSRLLGAEHERALAAAAVDCDRARGELLAMLFLLPGRCWSELRRIVGSLRQSGRRVADAR